jgi:hypothetical protein
LLSALQPTNHLVANTMNRRGQVLVKEARSNVADDDIAIGEWVRMGIGQLTFLSAHSGLKSDIAVSLNTIELA